MATPRSIPYWIQRADFSSNEFDPVSVEQAVVVFRNHDWRAEQALMDDFVAANKEYCPFGIGFVAPPKNLNLLHICPNEDGETALVHFHQEKVRRLLGFIPIASGVVRTNMRAPLHEIEEYIRRFFQDDTAWLEARIPVS